MSAIVVSVVISVVGAALSYMMTRKVPPMNQNNYDGDESATHNWETQTNNPTSKNSPVAMGYGEPKIIPLKFYDEPVAPHNNNSVRELGFLIGMGEIEEVNPDTIMIGDIPYSSLNSPVNQYNIWLGKEGQDADVADLTDGDGISMMKNPAETYGANAIIPESGGDGGGSGTSQKQTQSASILKVADGTDGIDGGGGDIENPPQDEEPNIVESIPTTRIEWRTNPGQEALSAILVCENGMYMFDKTNEKQPEQRHSVKIGAYYKKSVDSAWTCAWIKTYSDSRAVTLRWEVEIAKNLPADTYDVALVNFNQILPEDTLADKFYIDEIKVESFKSQTYRKLNLPGYTWMELKLVANDQVSGRIPPITIVPKMRKVRVYTNSTTYSTIYTNNPIWHAIDILIAEKENGGLELNVNKIDIDSAISTASWCEDNNITFNHYFDSFTPGRDALHIIENACMIYIVEAGDKIIFKPKTTEIADPVPFEVGKNILKGTFSYQDLGKKNKINQLIIDYANKDIRYKRDTLLIPNDVAIAANNGKIEEKKSTIKGIIDEEQAFKVGKLVLNESELIRWSCSFETNTLGLNVLPSDVIKITDDKETGWFEKEFRIKEIKPKQNHTVQIVCEEYNPLVYSNLLQGYTPTTNTVTDPKRTVNVTGLTVTVNDLVDSNGYTKKGLTINWTKPTDENYKTAQVWVWASDDVWRFVGQSSGTSFDFQPIRDGLNYKVAIVSVSIDGIANSRNTSPQVSVIVPYVFPPTLTIDEANSTWNGYTVAIKINPLVLWDGFYEIRTADPSDWETDASGLLNLSIDSFLTATYQDTTKQSVTIYARAKSKLGKYSTASASVVLTKTAIEPVTYPTIEGAYSLQQLRNGAFINNKFDQYGNLKPKFYDGFNSNVAEIVVMSDSTGTQYWGYGKKNLHTKIDGYYVNQAVAVGKSKQTQYYALSFWAAGGKVGLPTAEIRIKFYDDEGAELGESIVSGSTGVDNWALIQGIITVPALTVQMRLYFYKEAYYDGIMLNKGQINYSFQLHTLDRQDGEDTSEEAQAAQAFQDKVYGTLETITGQMGQFLTAEEIQEMFQNDSFIYKSDLFVDSEGRSFGTAIKANALQITLEATARQEQDTILSASITVNATGIALVADANANYINVGTENGNYSKNPDGSFSNVGWKAGWTGGYNPPDSNSQGNGEYVLASGNHAAITVMANQIVLGIDVGGNIAQIHMNSTVYGSAININANQVNITGFTQFSSGLTLAESINANLNSTIDGPLITTGTIIAEVSLVGAVLEIDSSTGQVYNPAYAANIDAGIYIGCTANPLDTSASRFRVDTTGRHWSGHKDFASAPFKVDENGNLRAKDGKFYGNLRVGVNDTWGYGNEFIFDFDDYYTYGGGVFHLARGTTDNFNPGISKYGTGIIFYGSGGGIKYGIDVSGNLKGENLLLEEQNSSFSGTGEVYVESGDLKYKDPLGNVYVVQAGLVSGEA